VEGVPVFALPLRGGASCTSPPITGGKVPLAGAGLQRYNSEQQQLLASNYLTSPACFTFFNGDPWRREYVNLLTNAVSRQLVWDGVQSTISLFDAGMSDGKNPTDVSVKKKVPVCSLFIPFHSPYGTVTPTGKTTAASQIVPPIPGTTATVIYINTNQKVLNSLTQSTILHEALHNLTGLFDFVPTNLRQAYGYAPPFDLKTLVGIEPNPGVDPNPGNTNDISNQLRSQGCAGVN